MALDASPQRELRRTLSGLEYLQRLITGEISESPFNEHLGIRLVHAEPGTVTLECTVRPEHLNKIGSGHGGFVSSMLDNACGLAVDTLSPAGMVWTTMDLHVRFLKAITLEAGTLRIVGHTDHVGRSTSVSHAEIQRADGKVLALATSSLYALDLGPEPDVEGVGTAR
ncbi:PaaI family thioesterase [Galactobacter caseinivorans]|uniref:PaaI family thioesterase n=1 Tax=Galactobacter caseinivorans TaxID=2676123 RepID=A0A496PLG0_9MICC|nr:PaaI family thioesterase [Galactobacter caseinivorans]RKW71357.1 PaaI family thioesterase [Galactobacter caseinivorans]